MGLGDIFSDPLGLKLRDASTGGSWIDNALSKIEQQRKDEEDRKAAEEARQRAQEQQDQLEARRAQPSLASATAGAGDMGQYDAGPRQKFLLDNQDTFGAQAGPAFDALQAGRDIISQWSTTPEGQNFLTAGGADRFDLGNDPYKALAKNKNFREFDYGLGDPNELIQRGVPQEVVNALHTYLYSKEGRSQYGGRAGAREAAPSEALAGALKPVLGGTGSQLAAGLVGSVLAPVDVGLASGRTDLGDPRFWGDVASMEAGVLGSGFGTQALGKAIGERYAGSALGKLGARFAAQAGLNLAQDVPLTAAALAAYGIDPKSPEGLKLLGLSAAADVGAGGVSAGIPGAAVKGAAKFVPPELAAGAVVGGGTYAATGDERLAEAAGIGTAGGTAVARRGLPGALKSGFGLTDVLPKNTRGEPIIGLGTEDVGGPGQWARQNLLPEGQRPSLLTGPEDIIGGPRPPSGGDAGIPPPPPPSGPGAGVVPGGTPPHFNDPLFPIDSREIDPAQWGNQFLDVNEQLKPGPLSRLAGKIPGLKWLDPTVNTDRTVLKAVLAGANLRAAQTIEAVGRKAEAAKLLLDAAGIPASKELLRAIAPLSAPIAGGIVASQTDDKNLQQLAVVTGLVGGGTLAHYLPHAKVNFGKGYNFRVEPDLVHTGLGSARAPRQTILGPAEPNVAGVTAPGAVARQGEVTPSRFVGGQRRVLNESGYAYEDLSPYLKSNPVAKFAHMVLFPGDFNLSAKQDAAVRALQPLLQSAFEAQRKWQEWAGMTPTPPREGPRLFQWWTEDSIKNAGLWNREEFGPEAKRPVMFRKVATEQERSFGDNIVEALLLTKHPELRLEGSGSNPVAAVLNLVTSDLQMKARIAQNALMAKALTAGPEGESGWYNQGGLETLKQRENFLKDRWARSVEAAQSTGGALDNELYTRLQAAQEAVAREEARRTQLGVTDQWQSISPELKGAIFSPSVIEGLKKLSPEWRTEGIHPVIDMIDWTTSNVRTALFSTDFSAWTSQGLMTAATNPVAFALSAPTWLQASILGDRYVASWVDKNRTWIRKAAASGLAIGRGLDELGRGDIGTVPVFKQLESRSFETFLPVLRLSMWKHNVDGELLLERMGWLGKGLIGRSAREALTFAPLAASIGLSDQAGADEWEQKVALALAGGLTTAAMSRGLEAAGARLGTTLSAERIKSAQVRVAKEINRSSGILNKPQYGITQKQGELERTFLFNSPAFTRNAFIALRMAAEGVPAGVWNADRAMAVAYLVRSAALVAGTMAGAKLLITGETDSLDPNDENSVLNPKGFGKFSAGPLGSFGMSNPIWGMVRAVFKTPQIEGADKKSFEGWSPLSAASGILDTIETRSPVIMGQLYSPLRDLTEQGTRRPAGQEPNWLNQIANRGFPTDSIVSTIPKKAAEGDIAGVAGELAGAVTPLPIQAAEQAGLLRGNALGVQTGDKSVNAPGEGRALLLGSLLGINANPETLWQERARRVDEAIRQQFPGVKDVSGNGMLDQFDLTDAQRDQFRSSPAGKELKAFEQDARAKENLPSTPVDEYYADSGAIRDRHVQNLLEIDSRVKGGLPKVDARKLIADENSRYQAEKDSLQSIYEKRPYTDETGKTKLVMYEGKAQPVSVWQYVNRTFREEDKAVDGYYALYDQAKDKLGSLDFDKLDELQKNYLSGLKPDVRSYVEDRLQTFANKGYTTSSGEQVQIPTVAELEKAKELAVPYWNLREDYFGAVKQVRPDLFGEFQSWNDFRDYIYRLASQRGRDPDALMADVERISPEFKRMRTLLTSAQRQMRGGNPALDYALADWYGYTPVNPYGYIANRYGDTSYDQLGTYFGHQDQGPSKAQQDAFERRFQTQR